MRTSGAGSEPSATCPRSPGTQFVYSRRSRYFPAGSQRYTSTWPSAQGFRYLLRCIDRNTCWLEVAELPNINATTVVSSFIKTWIARYRVPMTEVTDSSTQFTGLVCVPSSTTSRLVLFPTGQQYLRCPQALATCRFVFVRFDGSGRPALSSLYTGPSEVLEQYESSFKLCLGTRKEVLNLSSLKPAFTPADEVPAKPPKRGYPRKQPPSPSVPDKQAQGCPPSSVNPGRLGRPSSAVPVLQPPLQPGHVLRSGRSYTLTPSDPVWRGVPVEKDDDMSSTVLTLLSSFQLIPVRWTETPSFRFRSPRRTCFSIQPCNHQTLVT